MTAGCGGGEPDPADLSETTAPPQAEPTAVVATDGGARLDFDTSTVEGAADDPAEQAYADFYAALVASFNAGAPTATFQRVSSAAAQKRYAPITAQGGSRSRYRVATDLTARLDSLRRSGSDAASLVACIWRPSAVYRNRSDGSAAENADPVWDRFEVVMVRAEGRWTVENDVRDTGGEATCEAPAPS